MNAERKNELINWLVAVVPQNRLLPCINEIAAAVGCGSIDCVAEIIAAYVNGDSSFLGYEFIPMTFEQIVAYADKLKRQEK